MVLGRVGACGHKGVKKKKKKKGRASFCVSARCDGAKASVKTPRLLPLIAQWIQFGHFVPLDHNSHTEGQLTNQMRQINQFIFSSSGARVHVCVCV